MWPRVWQMACREEDIPNIGDYLVYEILDFSAIIGPQCRKTPFRRIIILVYIVGGSSLTMQVIVVRFYLSAIMVFRGI